MKDKNIFDILGNAEDDSMERLTEKCPDITDEQLEKIIAMSEKKYNAKKEELLKGRTEKDNNIKMTENDVVEGVERAEHLRRPVWFGPLCTAASLILVAGVVLGSMVMFRKNKTGKIDTGVIEPAVTATTTQVSGTTNISTDKNGSTITTTVTTSSVVSGTSIDNAVSNDPENAEELKKIAGEWKYQSSYHNYIPGGIEDHGTVVIKEDGTYTYTDENGNKETGTVILSVEGNGDSKVRYAGFMKGDEFRFGGYCYDEWMSIGDKGASRLVRGSMADTSKDAEYISYQNTANDLIEKYYDMQPQFLLRFEGFVDMNDTVTFKIATPYNQGEITDVVFARISGNGLELNSIEEIENYRRTVYSSNFKEASTSVSYAIIDDKYNSGDYIDESDVPLSIYYKGYILYRGNLYANTEPAAVGWIGHTSYNAPIVIKNVTSTSFRAYAPCIMGENNKRCDIVDFVIDPSCGEWRIDAFKTDDFSVYGENVFN